jgi:hypothetical protein
MSSKILLRIAAVLMFLHTIGHTMGALTWKKTTNPVLSAMVSSMEQNQFIFMGRKVSIALFYDGYGISMIAVLLLVSVLLWILSGEPPSLLAVKLKWALGIFLLLLALFEFIYFFPFAAVFSLLAGVCVVLARYKFIP